MEFLQGLSTIQLLALLAGGGYLVWHYWLKEESGGDLFGFLKGLFNKAKSNVPSVVRTNDVPSTVEVVEKWEEFRNKLIAANLTDAVQELDEIWKLLNPNVTKRT